ncbi:MAG TPA: hypothetical protein DCP92_00295 [Nitrospiraceae bacterium]|jgi:dTDP-4-amino-4,6-dideoxy-D-galactose acyltransferase|nr:hypothetical protein [Nitrospiraceae bacterium]
MIHELVWDTRFFGRKIGEMRNVSSDEEVKKSLVQAIREHFRYLMCRVSAHEIRAVQILENQGFYLTDVGVTLGKRVDLVDLSEKAQSSAKEGTIEDVGTLKTIAAGLFKCGRFYQDHFFTREEADRVYQAWAENSVKGFADKVFLIGEKGFITCRASGDTGDIPLVGVAAPYQGKGVGTALVRNALMWFHKSGVRTVTVRTQAGNDHAINFYERLGFRVKTVDLTLSTVLPRDS